MKKFLLYFSVVAVVVMLMSSCAATKRDCQGVKHYKQKGGFYM
jgi:predicted small secreted protein